MPGAGRRTRWKRRTSPSRPRISRSWREGRGQKGFSMLLAVGGDLWYALPLIVAVSLVYAATRHESMNEILQHAARVGSWIVGFMAVIFAVLAVISWRL